MFVLLRSFQFSQEILEAIILDIRSMIAHVKKDDLRFVNRFSYYAFSALSVHFHEIIKS